MPDDALDKLREKLAGFELLEKIGEGAMGAVYKARQASLDRIVAIKILPARMAEDATFVRQFQEEARAAARLSHPHLIEVYDAGKTDGTHFFVMEYVEGETVGDRLRREGPFHEHAAVGICMHVAEALQYAWEKSKLIHGDLKPENLILERESKRVRIADLGLAKCLLGRIDDFNFADSAYSMGTPAYVSPEQASGRKDLDFRADMYALGATLYHMLTGKIPFDGLSHVDVMAQHVKGNLPDPRTIRPAISETTVVVLERMLAKDPAQRYPTWAALAHDLAQIHQGRSPSVPPLAPGRSTLQREAPHVEPTRVRSVSPLRIATEVILITVALGVVYWYFRLRPQSMPVSSPPERSAEPPAYAPPQPVPETTAEPSEREPANASPTVKGSFVPSNLLGLRLWLSADKMVARDAEGRVSTWGDQSGHEFHATQNADEARPLYISNAIQGKPALRFDGKDDRLNFSPIDASRFTVFVVFSMTGMKPGAGPLNNTVPGKPGFQIVSGGSGTAAYVPAIIKWDGSEEVDSRRATSYLNLPFGPTILTWSADTETCCDLFHDGVEENTVAGADGRRSNGANIGCGFDYMAGDIAEVLVYNRLLSPRERQDVEQFLETKYAIAKPTVPLLTVAEPEPALTPTKPHGTEPPAPGAQARAEAERQYSLWRLSYETLLTSGEYSRARESAMNAQSQPQFQLIKDRLAKDERVAQLILRLHETAWTNLLGQTYYVGSTPGNVVRVGSDKFWVKLAAGEIAMPFDKVEPSKIPTLALSKNRNDPELNLAAGLFIWYRGEKDLAKTYFDTAGKAGADISPYLPAELASSAAAPSAEPLEPPPPPSPTNLHARGRARIC